MRSNALKMSLSLLAAISAPSPAAQPVTSMPALDISRYAGQWHQIAHLPDDAVQQDCAHAITVSYTLGLDDRVDVRVVCIDKDGGERVNNAQVRWHLAHPAQMELNFAPNWLSWWPFAWRKYWVIDLDPDYTWAVVGAPGRDHFWVLAREPWMDRTLFEGLKLRATQMGYDLTGLVVTAPLR